MRGNDVYHRAGADLRRLAFFLFLAAGILSLSNCRTLAPTAPMGHRLPHPPEAVVVAGAELKMLTDGLEGVLRSILGDEALKSLARAERVSFALFEGGGSALLLEGRYPGFLTSLSLDADRRWKRIGDGTRRWRSTGGSAEISLLESGVVALGLPDATLFSTAYRTENPADYHRRSDFLLVIPAVERLPAGAFLRGECRVEGNYTGGRIGFEIEWRFADEARARTSLPLIKLALWSFLSRADPEFSLAGLSTRVEGGTVRLAGLQIGAAGIETLLQRVLSVPTRTKE